MPPHTPGLRRATKEERANGLDVAFKVIMADAFHSKKANPCRKSDIRDAVIAKLRYNQEQARKFTQNWYRWLEGLPGSAGRLRPQELTTVVEVLGRRAALPAELRARLTRLVPDLTYHALAATFDTRPDELERMRHRFCDPKAEYLVFRYALGDVGKIAVGQMMFRHDPETDAIVTEERYRVRSLQHHFRGYLFRQKDRSYRIFSVNQKTSETQVMLFKKATRYDEDLDDPLLSEKTKHMHGMFLDRHEKKEIYTGKVVILRTDRQHRHLPIGTCTTDQIRAYDSTIVDSLRPVDEIDYKDMLFTFLLDS